MSEVRTDNFKRNTNLEQLLKEINHDLLPTEKDLMQAYNDQKQRHPLVLVMGPLRSGTTLFTQWLANSGLFAYPTNLLSRFYTAPVIGAKIQKLITDPEYNFRNELGDIAETVEYVSENGKTKGSLAPNEFWYFWRRFLPSPETDVWQRELLKKAMLEGGMLSELRGMIDVFNKPMVMKAMIFNEHIPLLYEILDNVIFIQLDRELPLHVQSVLGARKRQLGSEDEWYSFKISQYDSLRQLDSIEQVTGQIYYNNLAVEQGLAEIPEQNKIEISYEAFCQSPDKVFDELREKMLAGGYQLGGTSANYGQCFEINKALHLGQDDLSRINKAWAQFQAGD